MLLGYCQDNAGTQNVLILEAYAHLGNGEVLENSAIGLKGETITLVEDYSSKNIDTSFYDVIIHAKNKHLYPGFIAMNSTLGLLEIGAVRATRDYQETGRFNPNSRTLTVFNTDSRITPTVRSNGVLMGQISPRGGTISGQSSVMHFNGWNWEDAVIKADEGIHLNWPSTHHKHNKDGKVDIRKRKTYDQSKQEITNYFTEAKAYAAAYPKPSNGDMDVRHEGMRGLFDGSLALYVHADDARAISEAVHFKRAMGISRMVIVGGYDSYLVADVLRENGVSVLLNSVHRLPRFKEDDIDLPYKLPKLLADEGVLFGLQVDAQMTEMNTRNLPFYAGTARKYGLTEEQAIMSLTRNVAQILGVDDVCGSIERGKDATLFISSGDALDVMTNNLTHAFIQGKSIDLDTRQRELYRKFQTKYGNESKDSPE